MSLKLPIKATESIVFVPGPGPSASFVSADRTLLSELAHVVEVPSSMDGHRTRFAWHLYRTLGARKSRLAVLWFAAPGYGSLTAWACQRFQVPLVVIAGGADVAGRRDPSFGAAGVWWKRALVRGILERAAAVWAFSDSAADEIRALASPRHLAVVPPVVETGFYVPQPGDRERLVLSACAAITRVTIRQKGLDQLLEAARAMPETRFVVTGRPDVDDPRVLRFMAAVSPNVELRGFVSRETLRSLYARARVYAQLSIHEGFGVAVAEGVAMGCTPVVSDLPSLRAIAGAHGYFVPDTAPASEVAGLLARALAAPCPPNRWADIDSRFGRNVRRAAWQAELARLTAGAS